MSADPAPRTRLVIRLPPVVRRDRIPAFSRRVRRSIDRWRPVEIVCDARALRTSDMAVIDVLSRVRLAAARRNAAMSVRHAPEALAELADLCGLSSVLGLVVAPADRPPGPAVDRGAMRRFDAAMSESTVPGLVVADREGTIRYWSEGLERLFGHAAADAIGRSLDLIVPEAFRERHWAGFRAAMTPGEGRAGERVGNLPVRCADGQVRTFPGRLAILSGPRGEPAGAIGVFGEPVGDERSFSAVRPLPPR